MNYAPAMNVIDWLLDSDPAIRWQVMRDLLDAPAEAVAAERAKIAHEGWGARLLLLQRPDGTWAGGACFPADDDAWRATGEGQPWVSTLPTLQLLCEIGIDPHDPIVSSAVREAGRASKWEHAGQAFFDGEVEPCINGRTVRLGAYFGIDVGPIVERLLSEQLADGGWNCEAENGSTRSSFHTTINVLEGLRAFEAAVGHSPELASAIRRGEAYLLDRRMFRRLSTGEVIHPTWLTPAFPVWWHYDILRGLDYFCSTGEPPDPRLGEAIDRLTAMRLADGRWPLQHIHRGRVHFDMEFGVAPTETSTRGLGLPSRWITLRAMRVLRWWDGRLR